MNTKAIVTFGTGTHAELLKIALPSYRAFAHLHGYDLHVAEQIGRQRPAPWYKVRCIQSLLADYQMVVFMGCDMVIVDGSEDFDIPGSGDFIWSQAMVAHNTGDGHVPNTDMWICWRTMLPWLEKCWALDKYIMHGWWEQAALLELMGYEPDIRPTYCRDERNELYKATYFLDHSWNVHMWDRPQPEHPRIQHATMYPDRKKTMHEWDEQAKAGWMSE